MSKRSFVVTLAVPDGTSDRAMLAYLVEAVRCWCLHPDMQDEAVAKLDPRSVAVKAQAAKAARKRRVA